MEEEWTKHIHFTGGHCFQMYFIEFDSIKRFRIIMKDGPGQIRARDLDTGAEFEFNRNQLLKIEYSTLIEIPCQ